jgi:hypothetical protein
MHSTRKSVEWDTHDDNDDDDDDDDSSSSSSSNSSSSSSNYNNHNNNNNDNNNINNNNSNSLESRQKALSFCSSLFNPTLPYESEYTVVPRVRRLPFSQWGI